MKKFLAIYLGTAESPAYKAWQALDDAGRQQRQVAGASAWHEWMKQHAASLRDVGGPLGKTKSVTSRGVADIRNPMSGYAILEAESHEAAARLFENHPHFSIFPGESVEIMEILPIPGQA